MNKDINYTLAVLVPLLRMNGEKVVSVEAVEDWYEIDGREYMKEVAEITYENGYRQYADIGCDANLTAVYDVIRVIQQMKPKSENIERIVRDVYPNPEVPDTNVGTKLGTDLAEVGTDCISRQSAIDALRKLREEDIEDYGCEIPEGFNQDHLDRATFAIKQLPSSQPNRGRWISADAMFHGVPFYCSECGENTWDTVMGEPRWNFCPNCGAKMEGTVGRD